MPSQRSWEDVRAAKKDEQDARIPAAWKLQPKDFPSSDTRDVRPVAEICGILSARELEITGSFDATGLAEKIAKGAYSAEEVAVAFCKRAAVGHQLCNNLTEIMFLDAIEAAKKLDDHFQKFGKTVGPLHGLPMTFKECFHVKGYDWTDGYISRAFQPSTFDSYIIEIVRNAGAVVIAKTNNPQTMLVAETENNVFGRSKNPVVSHLTCGGSSGGEGSCQAFRSSALGIGTDVGGSIRIPASVNGVYGFKPTFGLLPLLKYAYSNWPGLNTGVPAVCGPLATSVRDLTLLTRAVRAADPWLHDPAVMPGIFERGTVSRKPVIGVVHKSGLTPHPPIQRALREASAKLKVAGFEVKEFNPPSFADVRAVTKQLFTADGLSYAKRQLEKAGEPVVASVLKIGFWNMPSKTPEELWQWNAKKLELQKQMLDAWREADVDVVLCPPGPYTAVPPNEYSNDMYTVVWNAMDYPTVIMPYTKVDPAKDPKQADFVPLSDVDSEIEAMYDPESFAGAPVAIQIAGRRLDDEQLLRDCELIDEVLHK